MTSRSAAHCLLCALLVINLTVAGCASDQKRKPRDIEGSLDPVQLQLTVGLPYDSDGNGFPDTVQALAYLFPDSRVSAIPVREPGTFEFVMHDSTGKLVAHWVFPPDVVVDAERNLQPGPGYSMYLRLAPGTDRMPPTNGEIRCRFVSTSGHEIRSTGGATVRLGG